MISTDHAELPSNTLNYLLELAQSISLEYDVSGICQTLLNEAIKLTRADGGTLYLLNDNNTHLDFVLVRNAPLNIDDNFFVAAELNIDSGFAPLPLYHSDGAANYNSAATYSYHQRNVINIPDIYREDALDFSGAKDFDQQMGYQSQSFLCVPLINKVNEVVGLFQLINAKDEQGQLTAFTHEMEDALRIFANFAASALDKQLVIDHQRNLLVELSAEPDSSSLVEKILREAKRFTNADGGTLYLLNEKEHRLEFSVVLNDTFNMDISGGDERLQQFPSIPLFHKNGLEDFGHTVTAAVHQKRVINIEDVYQQFEFDLIGTESFDKKFNYKSKSYLIVPLLNHEQEVIGVLQLLNAKDPKTDEIIAFNSRSQQLVNAMACYAAIALNNQLLVEELKALLDAFIKCIAQAIDAKSPHTSAHCQRIPVLTEMIAQAACEDVGTFSNFQLNNDEWYELNVASWLHDCGKLATPDSVLDKSTKLHLINDGIETIKARFASMRQQIEVEYCQTLIEDGISDEHKAQALKARDTKLNQLQDDLEFVIASNKGGEFMSDESKSRIADIAQQQWLDATGNPQSLLTENEIANLCIERGTLSTEERQVINDHMRVTIDMLESLPFPRKLSKVPEYAGGHHEKMDGSGFPKGLTREQMSVPSRMMAVADVFEALTASERPYKPPMKISTALNIMQRMVNDNHLDPDVFELFVNAKVWKDYAKQELKADQLDIESFTTDTQVPMGLH